MAASKFELTTQGISSTSRSQADALGGLQMNAGSPAVPVHDTLLNMALAFEQLEDAKAKAAGISSDPRFIAAYKHDQMRALVDPAYTKANSSIDDYAAALEKSRAAVQKAVLGPKVPAADSPMAAFQAEQITHALEKTPDGGLARVNVLAKYLRDAQTRGDNVVIDVILNRLGVVYDRLGIQSALLYQQLAQVMESSPVPDTSGNGALLAALSKGGSGTLSGLVDAARYVLTNDLQAYNSWLAGMLRDGQLRGPMEGGVAARPVSVIPGGLSGGPAPTFTQPPKGGTFGR